MYCKFKVYDPPESILYKLLFNSYLKLQHNEHQLTYIDISKVIPAIVVWLVHGIPTNPFYKLPYFCFAY